MIDPASTVALAFAVHAVVWLIYESKTGQAVVGPLLRWTTGRANSFAAVATTRTLGRMERLGHWLWRNVAYRLRCIYCSAPEWILLGWFGLHGWDRFTDDPIVAAVEMFGIYGGHIWLGATRGNTDVGT